MIIKSNKKAQSLAVNKLIIIILIILVVGAVLFFIFKADVLKYLRNLPNFGSGDEGDLIVNDCTVVGSIDLVKKEYNQVNDGDFFYVYEGIQPQKTNLYYKQNKIYLDLSSYPLNNDVLIGNLNINGININDIYLDINGDEYKEFSGKGLHMNELKILDGAYNKEYNLFCKDF